jgi:hypothetical protein
MSRRWKRSGGGCVADDLKQVGAADAQRVTDAMSFAAARRDALSLALDATPAERLAWLEEAIAIAYASGALPRRIARK